jgi:HlyD family secretion protein
MSAQVVVRDWKRPALVGYAIIVLTFGVFGGWAAYAKLDSAVVASGVVTVESSRKTIAHLEGGIVRQIFVREGQHVEEGQVLFRMDDTQSQAGAETADNQLAAGLATEARLVAERERLETIVFPPELLAIEANPVAKQAMADQRKQFEERRASIDGQTAILDSRIKQFGSELDGLAVEKAATKRQLGFIDVELVDLHGLLDKNLVPKSRVLSLEREKGRLEGVIGRSTADEAKAHNGISEARLQMEQLQKKFSEEVNTSLLEIRQKIADIREHQRVTADILRRIDIRAPRSGVVQNVKLSTIGGVVKPGEALLELIPDEDELVVNAQVPPSDVDSIRPAMEAEVRFSAFHGRILPLIKGQVSSVSRDRLIDEQTHQPYFLARIAVDERQVPAEVRDRITAGMQVEVIIPTGERTMVDYLVRPLRNRASKALREK